MVAAVAPILIAATAVIGAGAALQAATGMGMALFAAPILALIDPAFVPGPALCAVTALSAAVAWRERGAIDRRVLAIGLAGFACGGILGAAVLAWLSGYRLAPVFGVMILIAVSLNLLGLRLPSGRIALLVGGAASGVLGTMAGVQGPPIALVLQHEAPDRLRATLCAFFAAGSVVSLTALAAAGIFGAAQLGLGLALLPGVALGFALAPLLARRVDRRRARAAVLIISAFSALALLLR
jgi:uncharacterized membrane protein YfcA